MRTKTENEIRTRILRARLTPTEEKTIQAYAAKNGVTVGKLARTLLVSLASASRDQRMIGR